MGLVTFFIPLIAINPPVLETTHWSAFRTVYRMYEGRLPEPVCERCGEPLFRSLLALPFEVTVAYVLLVCALAALFFPESPKILTVVDTIGSLLCLHMGVATDSRDAKRPRASDGGVGGLHPQATQQKPGTLVLFPLRAFARRINWHHSVIAL